MVKPFAVKMMKPFLLLSLLFLSICSNAVLVPVAPASSPFDRIKIKPAQIEKLTGKKLTTLQKIKLIIVQKVFRKYSSDEMTPKQKKLARLSMILGFLYIFNKIQVERGSSCSFIEERKKKTQF